MWIRKGFIALVLVLGSQIVSAQTIVCPNVGTIVINGKLADLTYSSGMGFSDNNDTAYFVSVRNTDSVFQAHKWGAYIAIPYLLLMKKVSSAPVVFSLSETADRVEVCTIL